ncbi:MAG: hypothetical protein IKE43_06460 [Coriobacteriales bacterium]|nr:hypothetical protein [Coriobacteriales bacterium]
MKHVLRLMLYTLVVVLMLVSIGLLLLLLSLVSTSIAASLHTAPLALEITHLLPSWFAYWGVIPSPFGGVFRTDFFILSIICALLARMIRSLAKGVL